MALLKGVTEKISMLLCCGESNEEKGFTLCTVRIVRALYERY